MTKIKTISAVIFALMSGSSFADTSDKWTIKGLQKISEQQFAEVATNKNYQEITKAIYKAYSDAGYPVIELAVDVSSKTITIFEPTADVKGKYGKYFDSGKPLNKNDLELAILRMKSESNLNGDKVVVDIGAVKDGKIPMTIKDFAVENYKDKGGSVVFTTLGQRYSGPDVLTAYGWANIGNGQQIDASIANGFQFREQSEGGKYLNGTFGYKNAGQFGVSTLQFVHTEYKVGGDFKDLDLEGKINSINLKHEYLFTKHFVGSAGLTYKTNRQELGILDVWEKQDYSFITFGGTWFDSIGMLNYSINVEYEKGLGGSREFNSVPLMGSFNPNFDNLKANADLAYRFENGMLWSSKVGIQKATKDTPSANTFYIGGPDRGRAYSTGFATMPEGFYVSNTLNLKEVIFADHKFTPYVGYEYAHGKMATEQKRTAQSAFVGLKYKQSKDLYFDIVYAKEINADKDLQVPVNRLNLTFSWTF